jgi:hypothetical protein
VMRAVAANHFRLTVYFFFVEQFICKPEKPL